MRAKPDPSRSVRPLSGSASEGSFLRRREFIKLALLIAVTAGFILLMVDFLWPDSAEDRSPTLDVPDELVQPPLPTMDLADLQALPDLPQRETIAERPDDLAELERNPGENLAYLDFSDPLAFAWVQRQLARDREDPPVPQGRSTEELARDQISLASPILVSGEVVSIRDREGPEQAWLSLQLLLPSPEQEGSRVLALVHAPAWAAQGGAKQISVGRDLRVVGRYIGQEAVPTAAGSQRMPVIAAYSLVHGANTRVASLLGLGTDSDAGRIWRPDPDVFYTIEDYPSNPRISHLERRPYYYLIGQSQLDASTPGVFADARDFTEVARDVRLEPREYRGEVFEVSGEVIEVFEDHQVARDEPFGVERVIRLWVWNTVYPMGKKPFRDLYEVAYIAPPSAPRPEPGDRVEFHGRFLKVLMYYDPKSHIQRMLTPNQPNNDYTLFKFFVTADLEVLPPREKPDYFWLKIAALVVLGSFLLFMTALIILEDRSRDYRGPARRLRAARRQRRATAASAEPPAGEAPTAAQTPAPDGEPPSADDPPEGRS